MGTRRDDRLQNLTLSFSIIRRIPAHGLGHQHPYQLLLLSHVCLFFFLFFFYPITFTFSSLYYNIVQGYLLLLLFFFFLDVDQFIYISWIFLISHSSI